MSCRHKIFLLFFSKLPFTKFYLKGSIAFEDTLRSRLTFRQGLSQTFSAELVLGCELMDS